MKECGKEERIRKNDRILIGILLLIALLVFFGSRILREEGEVLVVTSGGKELLREPVTEEKSFRIEAPGGGYNLLEIVRNEDGELGIRCREADCPEQVCVEMGTVTEADLPIVCLPHQMTAVLQKK